MHIPQAAAGLLGLTVLHLRLAVLAVMATQDAAVMAAVVAERLLLLQLRALLAA